MGTRFLASLLVVAACVLLASAGAWAQSPVLVGRVTEVTDGDTIHVALASGPIIVRLHSIDTPERAQPWGRQATAALERRLKKGTQVTLQPITQDKYDRLVAVVYLDDENVNAWMVQQGHAWAYRQYLDDAQYCAWEQQARASGLGVWSLPPTKRIAPWEFRQAEREQTQIVMGTTVETEQRVRGRHERPWSRDEHGGDRSSEARWPVPDQGQHQRQR